MALLPDTAYLVQSAEDPTALLALDAKVGRELVEWFDTVRDRAFVVKSHEDRPDGALVVTEDATYELRRLTRELYDEHVRDEVSGHRLFPDTEAIQDFYRRFSR